MDYKEAIQRLREMRECCKTCYQHAKMTETEEYQYLKRIILESQEGAITPQFEA